MDWDVGALVEDTDKLRNFVEDDCDLFEYEQGLSSTIVVAGRLKSHIQFWRSIGATQFILDVIEHGYRIPFHSTPPVSFSSNNKSSLAHSNFVNEAISELLVTHRIFESEVLPHNGFTRVRSVISVLGSCPSASVQPLLFSLRFLGLSLRTGGGMVFTLLFILMMV